MHDSPRWIVLKFGGTSVASLERWHTIAEALRERIAAGQRPLVVCSALSGVSNLLERVLEEAGAGRDPRPALEEVFERHRRLAAEMELDVDALLGDPFGELARIASGAQLVEEVSPRVRARAMSLGELMSTRLGASWLTSRGVPTAWTDARDLLHAEPQAVGARPETEYLSARCGHHADPELAATLAAREGDVILTQGFIARNAQGETVLLGRGGSDTSAAYLAARVGADRLEIWTDVPGMFTANPRQVPNARLLRHLDYPEAEQLALMGGKVLHPRCIAPVATHGIPLHVKCTTAPDMVGTVVSRQAPRGVPLVKAVSVRHGIAVISVYVDRALENVGMLSRSAACFERRGLSIDMVSASETNVTFSLDPAVNVLCEREIEGLINDLSHVARAELLGPGAAVSLVGSNIRAILHELGPVLERFEDHRVYMVTQASDDLNLTFVVAEDEADRLLEDLHAQLFGPNQTDPAFGTTWEALFRREPAGVDVLEGWWQASRDELLAEAEREGTPCYVYRDDAIHDAVKELDELPLERLFYAVKANPHPQVLESFRRHGVGFQCGSAGELACVAECFGQVAGDVIFTAHAASEADYRRAFDLGAHVVVGSLQPLVRWPSIFEGRDIFLRVDPGRGSTGRRFVVSAGQQSKLGIDPRQLERAEQLVADAGARVVGLHAHAGSGLRTNETWRDIARFLIPIARHFEHVRVLDLGGGLGVPERIGHRRVDLDKVGAGLLAVKDQAPHLDLWMEPGRFLAARAGVLLARVCDVVEKDGRSFVTLDAGMSSLIRPALYGAWHETVNLTKLGEPARIVADVVGPLSDSADVLARDRQLPLTEPGDIFLIANAGAYGRSMGSTYNSMPATRETVHHAG